MASPEKRASMRARQKAVERCYPNVEARSWQRRLTPSRSMLSLRTDRHYETADLRLASNVWA
jgi:hypothetical protein